MLTNLIKFPHLWIWFLPPESHQTDFHLPCRVFTYEDNTSHEPHDVFIILIERPLVADNTYCALKNINDGRFLLFEITHMINSMVNAGQCFSILGLEAPCPTWWCFLTLHAYIQYWLNLTGRTPLIGMSAQCPTQRRIWRLHLILMKIVILNILCRNKPWCCWIYLYFDNLMVSFNAFCEVSTSVHHTRCPSFE